MFIKMNALTLLGALLAGGLATLGAPTPAVAQFGPGFGYGPGVAPTGGFGSINLNLGFGGAPGIGRGCAHGCRKPCGHVPIRPIRPVPPVCAPIYPSGPAFGYPGYGFGGGSYYRPHRPIYGVPGYGRFPGYCW